MIKKKKITYQPEDLTITFNKTARCNIETKCLTTQSSYSQNDDEITLKYFQKGKAKCNDNQTAILLTYLKTVENFKIENNQLHLILDAKSGQMIFE